MMNEPSFTRGRKWQVGFNVAVALLSAAAIVVMANYLAARHSVRYNWVDAVGNKLSPMTQRVLAGVTNKVKVIVFFERDDVPLFGSVTGLLKDYQLQCPKLEVEVVDYRYPGRSEKIRAEYNLSSGGEGSRIIFDCNGRTRVIGRNELSDFAIGPDKQIRRSAFKGEQLFTSAILGVTSSKRPRAYFLSGHGEHNPQSEDDSIGYSKFTKMLAEADVELAIFNALHAQDVPEDCSLLLILGPSQRFGKEELERLNNYLNQGGRMFVIFPSVVQVRGEIGLERLLAQWNVEIGQTIVRDKQQAGASGGEFIVANQFGSHVVTRALLRSGLKMVMPRLVGSKAIGALRADAPKTTELVFTSKDGEAVGKIDEKGRGELERAGSIPLAVAVEKGGIQGVATDKGATRIVVVGSSISFANAVLFEAGNADFATLAMNWLLNQDVLLTEIPPRAIAEYTLSITEKQMGTMRWIFLGAAPGGAMLIGAIVWLRRRS